MSTTAEEPADPLSVVRKQLILAQVQLLELEDLRDELQSALAERTQALTALQAIADQALAEAGHAAQSAEDRGRSERQQLEFVVQSLRADLESARRQLIEAQKNASQ